MAEVAVTPAGTTSAGAKTGGASAATQLTPAGAATGGGSAAGTSGGLGPAGANAGGASVLDATESRQPDDQTQTDKELLGLITETHSSGVRTVVRVLLGGIIVCLHFIGLVMLPVL